MSSPRDVKMKEEWDNMGSTDCEAALSMPWPIKSEPDVGLCFSDLQSHPIETGCCGLDSSGNEVKVLDIKSEIESCSVGGAENECKTPDIKTEIKSELTIDECKPSDLTRWGVDSLEGHVTPKEETYVVTISDAHFQDTDDSLGERQGVECDAEVSIPKKSHQDGRGYDALSYSETDEAAETLPDSSRGRRSSHGKRKATGKSCEKGSYPCSTCGATFTCLSNVHKHQILHSGQKTHVCQLCGKSFARKDYLNDHMLIHTTGRGRVRVCDRELNCSCDFCGKIFRTMHLLRQHKKRHAEDRPFKCDQCDKGFKLRQDLNDHLKTHSGERPHVCNACGQGFTRAYSLQKHLVVHTGQTPFSCTLCQRKFKSKWGLTCHIKKCTDTQPLPSSPHDVKMKDDWDSIGTDSEASLSMHVPIKSEPDVSLGICFSGQQSNPIGTGCCDLDSTGNEVKVLVIKSEIESCSEGGAEDEYKPLDIKTEIKSELTEEYQPSELTRLAADSPENHVMPKEESIVGDDPGSDVQTEAEASINIEILEKMQRVECDAEVLMPKKTCGKRKRSDRGRDKGHFPCSTCGISFTLRCNLKKHKTVHSKKK